MLTRTVAPGVQPMSLARNQPCGKVPVGLVAVAATKAVVAASKRQALPPPVKLADAAPVPVAVVPENVCTGAKVATTTLFAVILVRLHVAPVQSPLNAVKVNPALAAAVQLALPPLTTDVGVQVTVPPATGLAVPVIEKLPSAANVATTALLAVTLVRLHVAPVQSPLNAVNVYPALAVAVQLALPPWFTVSGAQLTVPPATGLAVAVTVYVLITNRAVTVQLALMLAVL